MSAVVLALLWAASASGADPLEKEIFRLVNQWRVRQSLAELRWNEAAAAQARKHSVAMAAGRRPVGHDGFQARVAALPAAASIASAAENVAASKGEANVAAAAVRGWAASAGHRENMSGAFNAAGAGVAKSRDGTAYVTLMFLKVP